MMPHSLASLALAICLVLHATPCAASTKKIDKFISILEERGFTVQEGRLSVFNVLELCSAGYLNYCFGNNAGFPYAIYRLPPSLGQDPSPRQDPPVGYDPDSPDNFPANLDTIPAGMTYKLRPDEAIVLIGTTPPQARYFSFRSYLGFVENKPGKDYTGVPTFGDDKIGWYHRIYCSLGDPLNHLNMWTSNTPGGAAGNAFSSATVLITTADESINQMMRNALTTAGYSPDIINDDNIPPALVDMGLEKGKDTFVMVMRAALWDQPDTGRKYLDNLDDYMRVFRITPNTPVAIQEPWPVPALRVRETGISEYAIVPNAVADLEHLRKEILRRHGSREFRPVHLDTNIWLPEGYTGIFRDVDLLAEDRDTTYLRTDFLQLATDDDFVIVYGINHEQTRKAIYSNFSFYGVELLNGVAGTNSAEYANSAADYFPPGYENAKCYYVYKIARRAQDGEPCVIVPYSTGNPSGKAFGVDNSKDAFIAFRAYIDARTQVGPSLFELIWDRAILFTKAP
jgi:hypothetical protein